MKVNLQDIKIESANTGDAEELLEIYRPYVEDTAITFEYDVPSVEEFRGRIERISAKYPYIKAVDDSGRIFGYAYAGEFKGRKAYERSVETTIYILKEARGCGLGRLLYDELEKRLKAQGILNMNACIAAPINEDAHLNDDSIKFHTRLGFELVGRFHFSGYKFKTWYDMVWMEKMLGEHKNGI